MSKLRTKDGRFKKGHHKVPRKHHKRRNPVLGTAAARLGAGRALAGAGRVARVLIVR
jgi:hypothetical protein